MKLFIYKSLFIFICIFFLFQFTIGYQIRSFEKNLKHLTSDDNIELIKDKLRSEMINAIDKHQYLEPSDAKLISNFIKKISNEINLNK